MVFRKVYLLPILFGFWMPLTVIITFTASVLTDHVTPILPYISDTGTWAPESCVFGMMLTIGSLLILSIAYVRFRHVADLQQKNNSSLLLRRVNRWSVFFGTTSAFGCALVANFQVSDQFIVHMLGAGVCFGFGFLYQVTQVILSFKMYPIIGNKKLNIFRTFVTTVTGVALHVTLICGLLSLLEFKATDMSKWKKEDGGYDYHLASAISEYILVAATVIHIVTFAYEFRGVEVHQPKINAHTYPSRNLN